MKGVMTRAVADAEADKGKKLAAAFNTVASKPVAGFSEWTGIAATGAAKAAAVDIDGAKESCKKCHSLYQKRYKETMRDQPEKGDRRRTVAQRKVRRRALSKV